MANLTIRDAFKALEDVEDIIEVTPVKKQRKVIKESVTKELKEECDGWIAIFNGKKAEVTKDEAKDLWGAKQVAIKKLNVPKSKYSLLSIAPAYNENNLEKAPASNIQFEEMEENKLVEEPVYDLEPKYDSRKSFYGKARVDARPDGSQILWSYFTPVCYIGKDGEVKLLTKGYYGWGSSPTTLRHVKDFLQQNGKQSGSSKELAKLYPTVSYYDLGESLKDATLPVNEAMDVDLNNEEEVKEGKKELEKSEEESENVEQIVDVDAQTIDELKDSYIGNVILQCPVCRTLIYKKPEALEKSEDGDLYNIKDECPHCGVDEGFELVGQVASLDVEPGEPEQTTGAPEDVEKEEPENNEENLTISDEETEVEEEGKEDEINFDEVTLESLDEEIFDKLINKYVHNIYENVDSYRTVDGSINDDKNQLVVEGKIKYNSGKEIDTKFVFEAISMTKNGQIKLKGLNETFTKAKKPFTMLGKVKDNSLRCESLKYNYNVKVLNESKKVKGQVLVRDKKVVK